METKIEATHPEKDSAFETLAMECKKLTEQLSEYKDFIIDLKDTFRKIKEEFNLLYINPQVKPSKEAIIDELTRKMTAAFRTAAMGEEFMGVHRCNCGAISTNNEYYLPNGYKTNSLASHYLAFHREEIPEKDLKKIEQLDYGEATPSEMELMNPTIGITYKLPDILKELNQDKKSIGKESYDVAKVMMPIYARKIWDELNKQEMPLIKKKIFLAMYIFRKEFTLQDIGLNKEQIWQFLNENGK